jgi:hypothetical protein
MVYTGLFYMVLDGYYTVMASLDGSIMVILCHYWVLLEPFDEGLALLAAKCAIYNHHLAANNSILLITFGQNVCFVSYNWLILTI